MKVISALSKCEERGDCYALYFDSKLVCGVIIYWRPPLVIKHSRLILFLYGADC